MAKAHLQQGFHRFDKFNFVESFIATVSDPKVKEEEKKRAVIIADAIEETQTALLEDLATKKDLELVKQDFRHELALLEQKLIIKLTAIMAALLTFLPLVTEFFKKLLGI